MPDLSKVCACPGCTNDARQGRWCYSCWADRKDGKPHEPRHPWSCGTPPCDGRLTTDDPVHHYVKVWHSDPHADNEAFLRKGGWRRHPKELSPMDSMDGR